MEIKKVGNFFNRVIFIMCILVIVIPISFLIINFKLDDMTPNKFIAVQIEGAAKLKPVIVQAEPILNTESAKEWVKTSVNYFMNYTSTNYIPVINGGARYMTPRFYPRFRNYFIGMVEQNIKNGYQISSSIVIEDPVFISRASVNGVYYYKYYVKTSTEYKAETRKILRQHDVIVTVKKENPNEYLRGIAIDDLKIK